MKFFSSKSFFIILLTCASILPHIMAYANYVEQVACIKRNSPCRKKGVITCPTQCPTRKPKDPKAKACFVNCDSPICQAECRYRKPSCNGVGAACYDPRFIGADGAVFYFHGRSNEHFTLVSDSNLQINARFIGHRPANRMRDYTWIQALGVLFGTHSFFVEATKAATWDKTVDHLRFFFDGQEVVLAQGFLSSWKSEIMEIGVNAVPITKEDDRIHNYQIPSDDCFSHLEVQFRFFDLSPEVEGVLGQTYRPDYASHSRMGIAMPVVGGEDKYRTSSLFAADCKKCMFSAAKNGERKSAVSHGMMDCSDKLSAGNGIACKK